MKLARPPFRRKSRQNRRRREVNSPLLPSRRDATEIARELGHKMVPVLLGVLVFITAASTGALGRYWLTTSPRFRASSLTIRGNAALSEGNIAHRLGLSGKENLFGLDLTALEASLEGHPWVAEARVERRLPDELQVSIVEHVAAGVVLLGELYLVDDTGRPFKRANPDHDAIAALPIVTGLDRDAYRLDPAATRGDIRRGLRAHAQFTAEPHRPAIGEVNLDERRGVSLITFDTAVTIRVGGDENSFAERFELFDNAWAALSDAEQSSATVIHVNRGTAPKRVSVAFAPAR